VELLPLTRRDYDFLFDLEVTSPLATTFRFRGTTPSPEKFPELLWAGVLAQYVMIWRRDGTRIGTAMCYAADFRNRHAFIAGALVPNFGSPYALEGFVLFLDHLFAEFDFRKLYGQTVGRNVHTFWSAIGPIVHEEGRLREHEYFNGRYEDRFTFAIYGEEWRSLRESGNGKQSTRVVDERLSALSNALDGANSSPLADHLRAATRTNNRITQE